MGIVKKADSLEDLLAIQKQINRMFQDRLDLKRGASPRLDPVPVAGSAWTPPVDVYETDTEIVLHAELPGFALGDLSVRLDGSILTIRGERTLRGDGHESKAEPARKQTKKGAKGRRVASGEVVHRLEREYGTFVRSFTLPRTMDNVTVEKSYRDGVLLVRLKKSPRKG